MTLGREGELAGAFEIVMAERRALVSSSYVLYLSLLLSSKVLLACGKTPVKQWHG